MSVMLDWKITITLEGKWTKQAIQDLNAAMHSWWGNWCDYAKFFLEVSFSNKGDTIEVEGYSNKIQFNALVAFSVNGDGDYFGLPPLEKRTGFDPTVHQRLLDSMKAGQSAIKFAVDEEYEGEPGEWYTINYKVISDGKRFEVDKDFGEADFLVTGKLCGDWSEEAIKMLNELMDYLDENEDAREYYMVRGVHFSEPEKESTPVAMGESESWHWQGGEFGSVMADAICDSGASEDLPVYQMLLDEMKAKDLRVLFRVSGNGKTIDFEGKEYIEYMMYHDGAGIALSEQGGKGEIYRTVY